MNMDNNKNNCNCCSCDENKCEEQHRPDMCDASIDMNVCNKGINCLPMLQTYNTIVLKPNIRCKKNVLTQKMMKCEDTKYVIRWDYDLNGQTITVPERCILEFDGGSLKNGTIVGQDTVFINVGDVDIWGENLTREGTWREHSGGGGSQVQSDWNQEDDTQPNYIKNKPTIPEAQIQSDWEQNDTTALDYIKNKPTIPGAQVQADWNQTNNQAKDFIKNKPIIRETKYIPVNLANQYVFYTNAELAELLGLTADQFISHVNNYNYTFKVTNSQQEVFIVSAAYSVDYTNSHRLMGIDGPLTITLTFQISNGVYLNGVLENAETTVFGAVSYNEKQDLDDDQKVQALNNIEGKTYNAAQFSGLGKVILPKNIQHVSGVDKNVITQAFFQDEQDNPLTNTIFVIQYDYTLGENITIPANCILKFEGGSVDGNYTIDFNGCGIEAPISNCIFGETLNIKGLQYAYASWLGIVPADVGSDSGSSKFIHFCSSPNCDGFELEFDRGDYRFALHNVLLNKYMKLKGAADRSTRWFITIDASCNYVIGVNRHCSVSNFDIRLASENNQLGVDFFRVSNEWADDEDAADNMKANYDYSFDTIWLKGVYKSDDDYTNSMNGIAIRIRDKQEGSSTLNKVLYACGPQHCENIMIEMVRAGIVFEVTSETPDAAWANGFVFNNIFVQGYIGYESIINNHSSSGKNHISNFNYQGTPNTHGLYGVFNGDSVVQHMSWDTYKYGTARGTIYMSNCSFSDNGTNPYTDLKNGFKPYNNEYPNVSTVLYKVNELRLTPTAAKPSEGIMLHKLNYSENYKRSWKTRTDQDQKVEEYLDSIKYSESVKINYFSSNRIFNGEEVFTIYQSETNATRITDWKSFPTGYGAYQDNAFIKSYKEYGFKLSVSRLNSGSFKIGDVLSFTYTFGLVQGVEDSMANKLLYINNIFCTAGEVNVSSITKTATNIVLTGQVRIKHNGSLANDGIGIEYKILEPSDSFTDETQTLWANKKYTESLTTELLYHTIGTTSERPTSGLYVGMQYFDTSTGIEKPIWYKGNNVWIDASGTAV